MVAPVLGAEEGLAVEVALRQRVIEAPDPVLFHSCKGFGVSA
jgi:hypothetical protein